MWLRARTGLQESTTQAEVRIVMDLTNQRLANKPFLYPGT